jgi:hypothetical protein
MNGPRTFPISVAPGCSRPGIPKRMNATTAEIDSGRLSLITHPQEVTRLILSATQAASQYAAAGGG